MKKSTLMIAMGGKPGAEDEELPEGSESEAEAEGDEDTDTDAAIDTFLDDSAAMETRREAFRRAVKGCY